MSLARPFEGRVWRILSPRWVHLPLSGEGAARNGGRWNRPGQAALYLSEQVETAFAEYQQELGVRPGTFVAYDLKADAIADLTDPAGLDSLGATKAALLAPWKSVAWIDHETPATWRLADRLAKDYAGLRAPSTQYPGGTNLVLWRWNVAGAPSLDMLDPRRELPLTSPEQKREDAG